MCDTGAREILDVLVPEVTYGVVLVEDYVSGIYSISVQRKIAAKIIEEGEAPIASVTIDIKVLGLPTIPSLSEP